MLFQRQHHGEKPGVVQALNPVPSRRCTLLAEIGCAYADESERAQSQVGEAHFLVLFRGQPSEKVNRSGSMRGEIVTASCW